MNFNMHCMKSRILVSSILLSSIVALVSACQTVRLEPVHHSSVNKTHAQKHMVASAHPLASEAGLKILRDGGSAVDAAISAQMVLNLVEPQSSGIGGGAFLLHFDSKSGAIESYDGREVAPQTAHSRMFLNAKGEPKSFFDAVVGGESVGVPGLVRMLEMVHKEHGKLPWEELFLPAIQIAKNGFPLTPRLAKQLAREKHLRNTKASLGYLYHPNGEAKKEGDIIKNPAFAKTMLSISENGADAFYQGNIARSIIHAIRSAKKNPGSMTLADLANYKAIKRIPVCGTYRDKLVCGMGPPSSGGIATLQILGLINQFDLESMEPASLEAVHLISEASALAFADRNTYIADNDFIPVPTEGLVNTEYLRRRATLINLQQKSGRRQAGTPRIIESLNLILGDPIEGESTTHLSVVDRRGNAVAMTSSIENAFGSRVMTSGFLLNNQLTDFSFRPQRHGRIVANRAAAGKRPRSSMSPTLVFNKDGTLMMAIGSPGGSRIIGFVIKALVGVIDWRLSLQEAIDLPNFLNRNYGLEIEKKSSLDVIRPQLKAMGHRVKTFSLMSGLQGIYVTPSGLEGGADKRREGVALGD